MFGGLINTALTIKALDADTLRMGTSMMLGANPDAGDVFLGKIGDDITGGRYRGDKLTEDFVRSGKMRGTRMSSFGSQYSQMTTGSSKSMLVPASKLGAIAKNPAGALLGSGMSVFGIGMSGYFAYQGYQEDGIRGAADALIYDVAVMSATAGTMVDQKNIILEGSKLTAAQKKLVEASLAEGTAISNDAKYAFTRTSMKGFGSMLGGGIKAGIGASIGQSLGGTAGAFVGAFAGTRVPLPIVLGGVIASAAAANIGSTMISSGKQMLEKGYQRRVMSRRIDTAGDTAAFFTRNANTMRQRSIMAMRDSHLNARSALGMEASMTMARRGYY
jgi:hypothetical protein